MLADPSQQKSHLHITSPTAECHAEHESSFYEKECPRTARAEFLNPQRKTRKVEIQSRTELRACKC